MADINGVCVAALPGSVAKAPPSSPGMRGVLVIAPLCKRGLTLVSDVLNENVGRGGKLSGSGRAPSV